jgi:hypothetical protein
MAEKKSAGMRMAPRLVQEKEINALPCTILFLEVIYPQVPLRIPCYDLALLTQSRFDSPNYEKASPKPHLDDLTGGVCKEQGLIHRGIMTRDY